MADFQAILVNALIHGEEWTDRPNGGTVRNLLRLKLDGRNVELIQNPDLITAKWGELKGQQIDSTHLVIRALPAQEVPSALELARGVATLLSFATCSEVCVRAYEHAEAAPMASSWAVIADTWCFCPTIETSNGARVRRFIEQCWPLYKALRDARQLNVVFAYYVLSQKPGYPLELKLVTAFVLLENLKHTWARHEGYPWIKRRFREIGATEASPGPEVGFKEMLTRMFRAVGMTPNLESIVRLRNELIHEGVSALSTEEHLEASAACQDLIREYLLRLLAYRGPYIPYSSPNSEKTLP